MFYITAELDALYMELDYKYEIHAVHVDSSAYA